MNVLLLSMPDSFEHMPPVAVRMPNGALASLAGNVDRHHRVAVADLVLAQAHVPRTVTRLVEELQPDVVGLSVMTFQRKTALAIARIVKTLRPLARIVAGGYDPSLAPCAYENAADIDFLVRGEGEQTFCTLLRAIEHRRFFVRSTNSGVSAVIDPVGRVVVSTPTFEQAARSSEVRWLRGSTPYELLGDVPLWLLSAAAVALSFIAPRRKSGQQAAPGPASA